MLDSKTFEYLQTRALQDPAWIIERFFWIIDKQQRKVPFILNPVQRKYYRERTWRDIILKARKEGFSSIIEAIFAVAFLFYPNVHLVTISHEAEATKRLFERGKFFIETRDPIIPCELEISSRTEMYNRITGSRWFIGTAGSRAFGRGDDIHMLHLSEAAYYQHWDVVTGAVEAVPAENKDTWIVFESTANGMNTFHDHYMEATRGETVYRAHFYGWQENPEYAIELEKPEEFEQTLDQEEQHLRLAYNLTLAQLNWRRQKIRSITPLEGYSREETFRQEYPITPEEAFLFSGNPFFPVEALKEYYENVKEPIAVGNLSGVAPVVFDETPDGYLKIWEVPAAGGQYAIFADVAKSGDYCCAYVGDKKTWEIVAGWHGRINPGEFGIELDRLGRFYNNALIAVEVNGLGQSTIDKLNNDLHYPHLYKRKVINKATRQETEYVGWNTTAKTRPLMLGTFQELVRTRQIGLPDKNLIEEMRTFVRNEEGRPEALEGKHDDRVIAAAGLFQIIKEHPYVEKKPIRSVRYKLPYKTMRWNRRS
ncbi:hypothetical protein J7L13_02920 [bacterium]|nr:hypothetical protein [bacterium]